MTALKATVISGIPPLLGWLPVTHLVQMTCRVFEADLVELAPQRFERFRELAARLRIERSERVPELLICFMTRPAEARRVLAHPRFRRKAALKVAWILDSFWTADLKPGLLRDFDLVVHTQGYDAADYARAGASTLCLPWGSDVLAFGSANPTRAHDVLRIGRQPDAWEDDAVSHRAAEARGLSFQGRPPPTETLADLARYYRDSRYVVAFSNGCAPAPYTHPVKEYFTGRWTDAIANGSTVSGVSPATDTALGDMLWPEALLEFPTIDLADNLECLREARATWTPRLPAVNHHNALMRLDWRWRLHRLAQELSLTPGRLSDEIAALEQAAARVLENRGAAP